MSNLAKRSITGILLVATIIFSLVIGHYTFFFLFLLIQLLCQHEFYRLLRNEKITPQRLTGMFAGSLTFIACYFFARGMAGHEILFVIIPLVSFIFIQELYLQNNHPYLNTGATIGGLVYIALPFSLMNFLVFPEGEAKTYNPDLLIGFFILVWVYDSMAYLSGMLLGRTPLFARVSPKKTWEGLAGGSLFTFLAAWGVSILFPIIKMWDWEVIAGTIIIFGTFSDLSESLLKRSVGEKNSSELLPGHGGLLDRFDTLLLSIPMIFLYLQVISNTLE